jgi:hypothetical protein
MQVSTGWSGKILVRKMTFEQRIKGNEGISQIVSWRRRVLGSTQQG